MTENEYNKLERAFGCVLGAFVGDAVGAVLEFFRGTICNDDIDKAF